MAQDTIAFPKKQKSSFKAVNSISMPTNVVFNSIFMLYSAACIIPLLLLLSVSFSSSDSVVNYGYRIIPHQFSLESYKYLILNPNMLLNAYIVTIIVAVSGTVAGLLINAMYAYSLSRKDFPWRGFFSIIILITMLFGGGLPAFYYVYVRMLHLKDTLLALILPGLGVGFNTFIMRTFFKQNIPGEIIESARMDGAGEFRTFISLIIPLSAPILATMALFSAIGYWNDFQTSMIFIENPRLHNLQYTMQKAILNIEFLKRQSEIMSRTGGGSISTDLAKSVTQAIPTEGVRMAMVIFSVGPIICVYPFLQRYFIKGLTIGSVKG